MGLWFVRAFTFVRAYVSVMMYSNECIVCVRERGKERKRKKDGDICDYMMACFHRYECKDDKQCNSAQYKPCFR